MKYKVYVFGLLVLCCFLMSCSKKSEGKVIESTSVPATTETVSESNEGNTIIGTVESREDFLFTVVDDSGKTYSFSLEGNPPERLDKFEVGDKVEITYVGKISGNGILDGTINSVVVVK